MSEKVLTGKTALRRVLPVMIAIVAIILIAVIMSSVKSSSPNPEISDKDSSYLTIGQYKVSKEKLYTYLRKNYGVVELARLVDEKLLENENITLTDEDTNKYIIEKLFDVEYDSTKHALLADKIEGYNEDPSEAWEDLKDTLVIYGSLKQSDRNNNAKVIEAMKQYFALDVKREKYAESYYLAALDAIGATTENGTIFTDAQIKSYYKEHYSGKSTGIYIPFDSEEQAKRVMEEIGGINVSSSLLDSKKGWVSANYNPQTDGSVEYLTTKEVVSAFVNMYNYMMERELSGSKLADLTNDDYTISYDSALQNALDAIKWPSRIESDTFTLPTEIELREYDNETNVITTVKFDYSLVKVSDSTEFAATQTVNEADKTVTFSGYSRDNAVSVKVVTTATIVKADDEEETAKSEKTLVFRAKTTTDSESTAINLSKAYLTEKFIIANTDTLVNSLEGVSDLVQFSWTHDEIAELDSTIGTYLKYDGSLKVATNADKFYTQYTVTPIEGTNYYYLMLKLSETEDAKLAFESDEDYEDLTADEIAASDALKAEIVAAMREDLFSTDIASKVLYEARTKNSLTIYDRYLEAVYAYNYDKFFTSTVAVSDYLPFNVSKETSKTVVASLIINGTKVEITADELFAVLEEKYGALAISSFVDDYLLLENNDVYNPYAENKIIDKDAYKEALKNEVATIRKNFEYDYFANSALEQYGITPAFPASYGWDNFKEDYFNVTDDGDLLASSEFGGSVYQEASEAYTKALYEDVDAVIAKIKENYADYYSVNVMNLVIYVDNDLDGTPDTYVLEEAEYNQDLVSWTPEQEALVPELVQVLLENAALTGEATFTAQMSALVTLYNKGTLTASTSANASLYDKDFFGKYKAAGLRIKWEDKATYDYKSSIVEEFSDELRAIYNDVLKANDLLDQDLVIPVMLNNEDGTPKVFATEFGYHYIAVTGSTSVDELPSDEEMKAIIAKYLYINSTEEEQATYKDADGFFDDLAKLTEDEQNFITSWYSPATEEMSGSNPIALALIADRTSDRAKELINFGNDEDLEERYNAINEVLRKSYEEEE